MEKLNQSLIDAFAIPRPRYVLARVLAASTAESITVPDGAERVILTGTVDFWADFSITAVIPADDITNGKSPILVPGGVRDIRELGGAATISVISAYVCYVVAEFYS